MIELPLTVLFHEGPMGRAYLEMMRQCGVRPRAIVRMIPRAGPLGRILPRGPRAAGLARRRERAANHWPRALAAEHPGLAAEMTARIETAFELEPGFLAAIRSGADLDRYCPDVRPAELDGFKDPAFLPLLGGLPPGLVLFTGGGILPAAVFGAEHLRLLHVHPGFLPHVRGADGILWSTLVRGRPGASAFIMEPGLDTGDLAAALETEPLSFDVPAGETPDDLTLYRMVFSYYDPVIRAHALRQVLPALEAPDTLAARPQDPAAGQTYHFMEPRTRRRALGAIFNRNHDLP